MTLSILFDKDKTQRILDEMPDIVPVWKVVEVTRKKYEAPFVMYYYSIGWNTSPSFELKDGCNIKYKGGFHSFAKKSDAVAYKKHGCFCFRNGISYRIIRFSVLKKDITSIGQQNFQDEIWNCKSALTIVSSQIYWGVYKPQAKEQIRIHNTETVRASE